RCDKGRGACAGLSYFRRKSRKNGCFGGTIGGIDGLARTFMLFGFELAGLGGALGSGGGSSGPYLPQAARQSASRTASAALRVGAKGQEKRAAKGDSGSSPGTIQKPRPEARRRHILLQASVQPCGPIARRRGAT